MKNAFYLLVLVQAYLVAGTVAAQNSELFENPLTFKTDLILMDNSHNRGIIYQATKDSIWVDISENDLVSKIQAFGYQSIKIIKVQKKGRVNHSVKSGFIVGSLWGSSSGLLATIGGGMSFMAAAPFFFLPIAGGMLIGALIGSGEWEKIQINGQADAMELNVQRLQEMTKYSHVKPRFYGIINLEAN